MTRNRHPSQFQRGDGHVHTDTCCGRRSLLGGMADLGRGTLLGRGVSKAQAPEKPFRIEIHHHFSSPGFIAEITGRKAGQVSLKRQTAAKSTGDMDEGDVATSIVSDFPFLTARETAADLRATGMFNAPCRRSSAATP